MRRKTAEKCTLSHVLFPVPGRCSAHLTKFGFATTV